MRMLDYLKLAAVIAAMLFVVAGLIVYERQALEAHDYRHDPAWCPEESSGLFTAEATFNPIRDCCFGAWQKECDEYTPSLADISADFTDSSEEWHIEDESGKIVANEPARGDISADAIELIEYGAADEPASGLIFEGSPVGDDMVWTLPEDWPCDSNGFQCRPDGKCECIEWIEPEYTDQAEETEKLFSWESPKPTPRLDEPECDHTGNTFCPHCKDWGGEWVDCDETGGISWSDVSPDPPVTVEWPDNAYLMVCQNPDYLSSCYALHDIKIGLASDGTLRWRETHEHDGCDHDLPELNPGEEE